MLFFEEFISKAAKFAFWTFGSRLLVTMQFHSCVDLFMIKSEMVYNIGMKHQRYNLVFKVLGFCIAFVNFVYP